MYSSGSFEQDFHEFVLYTMCKLGGWRLQLAIADMTKEMQKLDTKHNVNLYRKQYGNTEGALKALKNPVYYIDNTVLKMRTYDEVKDVYNAGKIGSDAWEFFDQAWKDSQEKQKEIMKVNGQNRCIVHLYIINNTIELR